MPEGIMSKAGKRILDSIRETRAELRGERSPGYVVRVPENVDVRAVRAKLGMTQREFAAQFGFGYDALRDWELGRRQPERSARVLLTIIESDPRVVMRALKRAVA